VRSWRWNRRPDPTLDAVGPATAYADQRGCYARGAAPAEQPDGESVVDPAWNEPTAFDGHPLTAYGQRSGYRRPGAGG
jgi:hypothetical protein